MLNKKYIPSFLYKNSNKKRKKWFFIILIKKEEALELNRNGIRFGVDGICTKKPRHKKYYLAENKRNLELLNELQNNSFIKQKGRKGGIK